MHSPFLQKCEFGKFHRLLFQSKNFIANFVKLICTHFFAHILSNFYVRQFFREKFAEDLKLLTFVLKIRFLQQCKK
jgi:hypothetical protein